VRRAAFTRRVSMNRRVKTLVASTPPRGQPGRRSSQYSSGGKYKAVDNSANHCAHSRSRQRPYASIDRTTA